MPKVKKSFEKKLEEVRSFVQNNLFYILIGATILVVGSTIVFNYSKKAKKSQIEGGKKVEKVKEEKESKKERVHIVKRGEHLWGIAEKYYGSGYNAVDIAKANKIKNPNVIYVGQKLVIPSVKPRKPTTGEVAKVKTAQRKAKIEVYTVKKGDYLWKIALEVYGDGYAWVKIARANRLKNPGLIYPGQKLRIP